MTRNVIHGEMAEKGFVPRVCFGCVLVYIDRYSTKVNKVCSSIVGSTAQYSTVVHGDVFFSSKLDVSPTPVLDPHVPATFPREVLRVAN